MSDILEKARGHGVGGLPDRGLNMQLMSGKPFYPMDPRAEDVDIRDIAASLSKLCRFNGHCRAFYSVAQHSIHVSFLVPAEDALAGLLHDATEAYVGELMRPIKLMLPDFIEMENRIGAAIAERFGLDDLCPPSVKEADTRIVVNEKNALLNPSNGTDWGDLPRGYSAQEMEAVAFCGVMPPEIAERVFLDRFHEIIGRVQ